MGGILKHQMHIVGDHNDGDPLVVKTLEELHDLRIVVIVLTGGGLVQNEYLRLHD